MRGHGWVIAMVLVLAPAGCGGDDESEPAAPAATQAAAPADERIDAQGFRAAFEAQTKVKLDATPNASWTLMSPTVEASSKSYGEYGSFSLYVMKSIDDSLKILTATEDGTPVEADDDGLFYIDIPGGRVMVAKVYEPNVLVQWQAGEERATTDTFDRLDAAIVNAIEKASA